MCRVVELNIDGRLIRVADVKQKYMANIIDAALFGSACGQRCTEESDIDLAIFGNQTKYKCLMSKKYRSFLEQVYQFDNHNQAYDFLYFRTGDNNRSHIMSDIEKGEVLYVR